MKAILEKALTIGSIITPFAIVGELIYNNDNCRNNFNAYCKGLEVLFPNQIIETDSERITIYPSRYVVEYSLLVTCITIPILILLRQKE